MAQSLEAPTDLGHLAIDLTAPGPRPLVLHVEDNEIDARVVGAKLKASWPGGVDIVHVRTVAEAHAFLLARTPSCVLLDLELPDARRFSALEAVRAVDPDTGIVVLTGHDDDDGIGMTALRHGAQDYLVKTRLDAAALVRAVRFAMERTRVAKLLSEQERHYRVIVESMADHAVIGLDPTGLITSWDGGAPAVMGHEAESVLGAHVSVLYCDDDVAAELPRHELDAAIAAGRSELAGWRRRADGSRFWADTVVSAVRTDTGVLTGLVVIARDLTQRRAMEEALRASEERTRSVIQTASDAFIAIGRGGEIEEWNHAAETIFGWTRDEVIGQPATEIVIPPAAREVQRQALERWLATPEGPPSRHFQLSGLHRDGHELPLELALWPSAGDDGTRINVFARDISARQQAEDRLRDANETLSRTVSDLAQRNHEIALVNEMADLLQSCLAADEVYAVIADFAGRLFTDSSGAIAVLDASGTAANTVVTWGEASGGPQDFDAQTCWALRLGRVHANQVGRGVVCGHLAAGRAASICVPMMAHGAATGVLHLELPPRGSHDPGPADPSDALGLLALAVADHLSLALANFNLRQRLLEQSLCDSLTGLFNRRYLYETIDARIRSAATAGLQVGVLMIDLDHFKAVNDRHGHAAGDTLLRAVADLLATNVRDDDLVCRLGGEEFLLVVPGPGADAILARAERLAAAIRETAVEFEATTLTATVSIGVAVRPAADADGHDLIRAADEAMYEAKASGRDRVCLAQ